MLRKIFQNPFYITLISFLIWLLCHKIIDSFKSDLYSFSIIFFVFVISTVIFLIRLQWLKLIFLTFGHALLVIIYSIYSEMNEAFSPLIGTEEFYSNEIQDRLKFEIPKSFKIIAKLDTVKYIKTDEEYHAECLYFGDSKILQQLEGSLIKSSKFIQIKKLEEFPTKVINAINFNPKEIKSLYLKKYDKNNNDLTVYIAFNKSYSKLYYQASFLP